MTSHSDLLSRTDEKLIEAALMFAAENVDEFNDFLYGGESSIAHSQAVPMRSRLRSMAQAQARRPNWKEMSYILTNALCSEDLADICLAELRQMEVIHD